ncbi:MAG: Stp1/IreP family PP2C-type Ser/Thr phosphatase [Anaerorhabdus sp.]|uniref:Stp1/IreP family PP2C-type Ser/Thr phosphatase n=1 Tax=Anaerorhabdus sp. TaxID=1872524 RepID=UPI003A852E00
MRYYGVTDKGLVRKTNQDNYVIASNEVGDVFAIVCDGIGGGKAGDVASKIAIDYFSEVFSENKGFKDRQDVVIWIRYHISKANDLIFVKSTTTNVYKGMGTTFVGVLLCRVGRFVVNIGDSRVYCTYPDGRFIPVTKDHTLVNDLLKTGEITKEEAEFHPKKNVLTNALGVWDNVRIDIEEHPESISSFLICSDGLYGYVEHDVIKKVMTSKELSTTLKVRNLLNKALRVGGYDNITIILIELEASDNR